MRNSRWIGWALPALLAVGAGGCGTAERARRLAQLDEEIAAVAPAPSAPSSPMAYGHSHNDYEQKHPLRDALALGYSSVEADVWWSGGEVKISHHGWFYAGTLRELYLEPLQARVSRFGSVYGDGAPFLLWLDLKHGDPRLLLALHQLLATYPMIAATGVGGRSGAVTAILTGDEESKAAYERRPGVHYACRDSDLLPRGPEDPQQPWATLNWNDWFNWDGRGEMPETERARLRELVARTHGRGRKLRLYALPESESVWTELVRAGVDLIGTDELPRLQRFLAARVEPRIHGRLAGAR